jgi:hypothetical protein
MAQSTAMRPQPPSISDPKTSTYEGWSVGEEDDMEGQTSDGSDEADEDSDGKEDQPNWAQRAKDAKRFSTTYIDTNYRGQWEDSIRAFNNQHKSQSKYNSELFRKRSSIYRPKTRTVIRKNEAAAAAAFFSNLDLIEVETQNGSDQKQQLSADVMKAALQYRLTKSIPWFHVVQGGIQDAQVQGVPVAHVYWKFSSRRGKDGKLMKGEDKPAVDLIPIENIRIDPSAHWYDPINTSPYVIHCIPMYYGEVKDRMSRPDPKGRRWKFYPDAFFRNADNPDDSTRQVRMMGQEDATQKRRDISDYDIVWIDRHIHRWRGTDYEFYTIDSQELLTSPEPLENTVFHGKRPYVMGCAILETHKPMPSSVPKLGEGIQEEINETANQRLDNVKLVLNKRWFAKRGVNVDLASLIRNTPGQITLLNDPEKDVKEVSFQDVTASAYKEQEVLSQEMDELLGNFSPNAMRAQRSPRESEGAMLQLQAPSNLLTEYMLKTYVETFIEPVVRQLVLLEQHYETDEVVLAIAGEKAKARLKFGVDQVNDDMLDPVSRLQRFVFAIKNYQSLALKPPPGIDLKEVWNEICALSGYKNGARFTKDQDPDKVQAEKVIHALQQKIQQLSMKQHDRHEGNVVKLMTAREKNATSLLQHAHGEHSTNKRLYAEHLMAMEMQQLPPSPGEQAELEQGAQAQAAKQQQQQPGAA